MAPLIVRRLDDAVKERLRVRARKHGRSPEAEARAILKDAALAANLASVGPGRRRRASAR
jgi:plasmid stability protein